MPIPSDYYRNLLNLKCAFSKRKHIMWTAGDEKIDIKIFSSGSCNNSWTRVEF